MTHPARSTPTGAVPWFDSTAASCGAVRLTVITMTDAHIAVVDEGERTKYTPEEYVDEGGSPLTAKLLTYKNAALAEGQLGDEVQHNDHVVDRADEEDAVVARIEVPYWFRQKDDEVAETFDGDDRMTALVEDYSDKAWRIIAGEEGIGGDFWFTWEWTFVPKSVARVTLPAGWSDPAEAKDLHDRFGELERELREAREEAWENADDWEEKLEVVDG